MIRITSEHEDEPVFPKGASAFYILRTMACRIISDHPTYTLISSPCSLIPGLVFFLHMKTLLRTLLYLAIIVWLGAEVFFPVVAAVAFSEPGVSTHTAGSIVGKLIRDLHGMGLVSGMVALALLALAAPFGIYKPRNVLAPMAL